MGEGLGLRLLRASLRLLPGDVRREYAAEIEEVARRRHRRTRPTGVMGEIRFWAPELRSVGGAAAVAWMDRVTRIFGRGAGSGAALGSTRQAVSLAFRTLRRSPAFSTIAILVMAVGVGANTAVFSLANWALLRPIVGIQDPASLVGIQVEQEDGGLAAVSHPTLERLQEGGGALSSLAAYTSVTVDLRRSEEEDPARVRGQLVTSGFFRTLGTPVRGRTFLEEEGDRSVVHAVAVVAPDLLGPDQDPLGKLLLIGGRSFEVVGVAPLGFQGVSRSDRARIWLPSSAAPAALGRVPPNVLSLDQFPIWVRGVGRAEPGASFEGLADALASSAPELAERGLAPRVYDRTGLPPSLRPDLTRTLTLLAGLVGLLLLLTVGSLGNLFLTRVASRRHEAWVRRAVGASEGRLTVDLLAESQVLGVVGALVAMGAAWGLLRVVDASQVLAWLPKPEAVSLDTRVLAFALAVTLGAAFLSALVGTAGFRERGASGGLPALPEPGQVRERRLRRVLVGAQVGLSLILIIGASLAFRSFGELRERHLGLDADEVLAFSLNPAVQGHDDAGADEIFRGLLDELRARPDVGGAAFTWLAPLAPRRYSEEVTAPGMPGGEEAVTTMANMVSPGYFEVMGIPLVAGRDFGPQEYLDGTRGDRGEVLVNETLARRLYADADPVGRELRMGGRSESAFEIVGLVADARLFAADEPAGPQLFDPFGNGYRTTSATFVVRGPVVTETSRDELMRWVEERTGGVPILEMLPLERRVQEALAEERALARILAAFALLSLVLATAGLFGLVAEAVHARTREFGIRQALGAGRVEMARLVVWEAMVPVLAGAGAGFTLALALAPQLEPWLLGMEAVDGPSFVVSTLVLALSALAATLRPLLRALRADPRTVTAGE